MGAHATCPKCGGFIPDSDPDNAFAGACPWCMAQDAFDPKPQAEELHLQASTRLGKYQLTEKLGRGGMGEVWKALDTELNRWVALKFMKAEDPSNLARLQREAHTAAGLTHPNIAGIYEIGEVQGKHFIAMQFVEGRTLESYSRKDRRLLIQLVRDAARAVDHAHRHGIIHRDVKPANIMVEQTEEGPRAIVLDFGLARPIEGGETLSHSGSVIGTPAYMSPQQARGEKLDERTDVYSLGATLYELLTGKAPFEGTGVLDVIKKVEVNEPHAPRKINPHIPRDLETVTMKCLEKDRDRRYGSAKDLADDLSRWLAGDAVMARPASTIYRLRMKLAKRRAVVVTAAVGLAASALLAVSLMPRWYSSQGAERAQPHLDLARMHLDQLQQLLSVDEDRRGEIDKLVSQARASLQKALQESPNHAESLYEMGKLQWIMREREAALDSFTKAIEAAPRLGKAYLERAMVRLDVYERLRHNAGEEPHPENEEARRVRELLTQDLDQARAWSTEAPKLDFLEGLLHFCEGRYSRAAEKLGEYLKKAPSDWRAWMWRGHALVHTHQDRSAVASLDRSLALRPRNVEALFLRGAARERLQDFEGALRDFDKRVDAKPNWAGAYVDRGAARARRKDFQGAIRDYDKAIELDAKSGNAYRARGFARFNLGDYEGVIQDCDKAIELDSGNMAAYETRGHAWMRLGNAARALPDFSRAIELDPKEARLHNVRGAARAKLGESEGALRDYDRAIELDPKLAIAFNNRGLMRARLGDHAGAIRDYDQAIQLDPAHAASYASRSIARANLKDFEGALRDGDKAVELDPTESENHRTRGMARVGLGDPVGAIRDLDKAIELDPKVALSYSNRGAVRVTLGEFEKAIRDLDKATELDPQDAIAFCNRGLARESLKDHQGALRDYDKAIELKPGDAKIWLNRGAAREDLKDYEGAIRDYDKAIGLDPKDASIYRHRAFARVKLKVFDNAMRDCDKAIQLDPKAPSAFFTRGNVKRHKELWEEALVDYRKALELAPRDWHNRETLVRNIEMAEIRLQLKGREKEYKEAEELFKRSSELLGDAKEYRKAVEGFQKIAEAFPKMPLGRNSAYNAACGFALLGEKEKALDWLDKAVKLGFVDAEHIDRDSDLDSLRDEARFKKIVEGLKSR